MAKTSNQMQIQAAKPTITARQQVLINSLLAGKTITASCEDAGVSRCVYYDLMNRSPLFVDELNRQRDEQLKAVRQSLKNLASLAIGTLEQILTDREAPAGARVRAAIAVLNQMGRQQVNENDRPLNQQIGTFLREMMR